MQCQVCLLNKFSSVVHPVFPLLGTKVQIGSILKTCGNVDHYLLGFFTCEDFFFFLSKSVFSLYCVGFSMFSIKL